MEKKIKSDTETKYEALGMSKEEYDGFMTAMIDAYNNDPHKSVTGGIISAVKHVRKEILGEAGEPSYYEAVIAALAFNLGSSAEHASISHEAKRAFTAAGMIGMIKPEEGLKIALRFLGQAAGIEGGDHECTQCGKCGNEFNEDGSVKKG